MKRTPMNTATVHDDGSAIIDLDGHRHQLAAPTVDQARHQAMALAVHSAATAGQPVLILATDPSAQHLLEVHPDGTIRPAHHSQPPTPGAGPDTPLRRHRWSLTAAVATTAAGAWIASHLWSSGGQQPTPATSPRPLTAGASHTLPGAVVADVDARPTPPPARSPIRPRQPRWIAAAGWERARADRLEQRSRARAASQSSPAWSPAQQPTPAVAWTSTPPVTPAVPRPQLPPPAPPVRPSVVVKPDPPSVVVKPDWPDSRLDPTNPDAGGP